MIFADAFPDLPTLLDFIQGGGLLAGLIVLVWLLITDRLITPKRLDDANARTERAEKQRDDALALAHQLSAGMNELTGANRQVLDFVKESLARGTRRQ